MEVSQEVKIEPPYDPAIAYMGIYLEKKKTKTKTQIQKDTCSPMFIEAFL